MKEIVAWYRKDNRAIVWWGPEYPVHWEDDEGAPLFGDPETAKESKQG